MYVVFVMMQVVFVIVELKISIFFAVIQCNRILSQITCFLSMWQVFGLGTFLVAMCLYVFIKPQTKCSPDGCHENAFLATF